MNYFIKFVFFDAILGSSRLQYRLNEKLNYCLSECIFDLEIIIQVQVHTKSLYA